MRPPQVRDAMRLFVALDPPEDVRSRLAGWAAEELGGGAGVRVIPAEALHVTLCFLGRRPAEDVAPIAAACREVGSRAPMELSTQGVLSLPRRRPRAVAVRLTDGTGALAGMRSELAVVLERGGWYEPEHRPFQPHITVVRVRAGRGASPAYDLDPPSSLRFTASQITLYRSHTEPAGARYESLERVTLTPGSVDQG